MSQEQNERHRIIEEKLAKLELIRETVEPYPHKFERTHTSSQLHEAEAELVENETVVRIAGRIMAIRGHGKAGFGNIFVFTDVIDKTNFRIFFNTIYIYLHLSITCSL